MADQDKSTHPAQSAVFREGYLTLFEHPDHEAALRLAASCSTA